MNSEQFTVYSVQSTVKSVKSTVYSVQSTVYCVTPSPVISSSYETLHISAPLNWLCPGPCSCHHQLYSLMEPTVQISFTQNIQPPLFRDISLLWNFFVILYFSNIQTSIKILFKNSFGKETKCLSPDHSQILALGVYAWI